MTTQNTTRMKKPLTKILKETAVKSAVFFPVYTTLDVISSATYGVESHTSQETLTYTGMATVGFAIANVLYEAGRNMYHKRKQNSQQ